tara:strand:- start:1228 stop:2538 length:1311 start_codon:yes stop_codon:yes gene_type:complete
MRSNIHKDLRQHIDGIAMVDTHEHMSAETSWTTEAKADILCDLFDNYVVADFASAGQPDFGAICMDTTRPVSERWAAIETTWDKIRLTGYGEAVSIIAKDIYEIYELNSSSLESAAPRAEALTEPGERYRLLKEVAHLDHIQTDNFSLPCLPDEAGPDFFLFDINWAGICGGNPRLPVLEEETGITISDLRSYGEALDAVVAKHGGRAIAMKSQHAYSRTLQWSKRDDADAERALTQHMREEDLGTEERLCLGDWGWDRGARLAAEHNLPFKIHTGYYAGNNAMVMDRIPTRNLCPLILEHLDTTFVLMHIAYPYSDELIAMTKHFPNIYADLCWAWSINPLHSVDFVRRFIHAAPINKLFAFGGDTFRPTSAVAYAKQTRRWLARCLTAEVEEDYISIDTAKEIADRLMRRNQYECFDVAGTRQSIEESMQTAPA